MKPSITKLGLEIQLFLMRQGIPVETVAEQMGITADALSNLIHGRRRFKDETLARLAATATFQQGAFTLSRLKALRALDEYGLEELILAVAEAVRQGEIERLPNDFFEMIRHEMDRDGFPPMLADKRLALLALLPADPSQTR